MYQLLFPIKKAVKPVELHPLSLEDQRRAVVDWYYHNAPLPAPVVARTREFAEAIAGKAFDDCYAALLNDGKAIDLIAFLKVLRYAFPHWRLRGLITEAWDYRPVFKNPAGHDDASSGWMLDFAMRCLASSDYAIFEAIHDGTIYSKGKIIFDWDCWKAKNFNAYVRHTSRRVLYKTDIGDFTDVEMLERYFLNAGGASQVEMFTVNGQSKFGVTSKLKFAITDSCSFDQGLFNYYVRLRQGKTFPIIALYHYNLTEIERLLNDHEII
jgi:hypothetical protein